VLYRAAKTASPKADAKKVSPKGDAKKAAPKDDAKKDATKKVAPKKVVPVLKKLPTVPESILKRRKRRDFSRTLKLRADRKVRLAVISKCLVSTLFLLLKCCFVYSSRP